MVHMTCFIMVILNYLEELVRWGIILSLRFLLMNSTKSKQKSYYDYEQRKMMLESIRYVDLVIPEEGWGQKEKMLIVLMLMYL